MSGDLKTPCTECPWRRDSVPGQLGSREPATTFIGQAYGPFRLPCHCGYDSTGDDPNWRDKANVSPQCAGAAIFRANIRRGDKLPEALHRLPADSEKVFATAEEFLAHHTGCSLEKAEDLLAIVTPIDLMKKQLIRPTNKWLT